MKFALTLSHWHTLFKYGSQAGKDSRTLMVGGHKGNINSVDFSHSTENYLLTAGDDRYVM